MTTEYLITVTVSVSDGKLTASDTAQVRVAEDYIEPVYIARNLVDAAVEALMLEPEEPDAAEG